MSEGTEGSAARQSPRSLPQAVREAKNAAADRSDVVVDLRDAERMRLELLAAELQPVFDDVPADVELFDFAISSGLQPRLWIDVVSHVSMGRDKRTYRFVREGRQGRVVLAESTDLKPVADQVTRYVAERLVERERAMTEGPEIPAAALAPGAHAAGVPVSGGKSEAAGFTWASVLGGLYLVASGFLLAVFAALVFLMANHFDELLARVTGR